MKRKDFSATIFLPQFFIGKALSKAAGGSKLLG